MLRRVLAYAAVLVVGIAVLEYQNASRKDGIPANTQSPPPAVTSIDWDHLPVCTPDTKAGVLCQDPPAPPQDQPQPTWKLDRSGLDHTSTALFVICAPISGPHVVSEYWPHTPAGYQAAVAAC
jgi:hypothetical protein